MTDTSQEIKKLQLKIWLAKSPMERLQRLMIDNDALINFWKEVKPTLENTKPSIHTNLPTSNL